MFVKTKKHIIIAVAVSSITLILSSYGTPALADAPVKIMPLGDSITKGALGSLTGYGYRGPLYFNLLDENIDFVGSQGDGDFPDPEHEGYNGEIASWINTVMLNRLTTYQPDIILYHIGTNDLDGSDINSYAQDADDTLDIIFNFDPNTIVILAKIILTRDDPDQNIRTHDYNILLDGVAQSWFDAGYTVVTVDMENALNNLDMDDNLHPNDAGYANMANVWYDGLIDYLDTNMAPTITSIPVTEGTVGQLYTYDVDAIGFPDSSYALDVFPAGMSIDPSSGLIEWVPPDDGHYDVVVKAANGNAPDAVQAFEISVADVISFDASSSSYDDFVDNFLSLSHTVGNGDDRILIVGVVGEDSDANDLEISSIDFGGIGLDLVSNSGVIAGNGLGNDRIVKSELYYLLAPQSGMEIITVTYSGSVSKKCVGAVSLENVEQQAPEAVNTGSVGGTNIISTNITTLTDGAWVVDVVGSNDQGSFTEGSSQIEWFDIYSSRTAAAGGTAFVASTGATDITWDFSVVPGHIVHSLASFSPKQAVSYDVTDILLLARNWLTAGGLSEGDLNEDGFIDAQDMAELGKYWHP